MKAPGNPEHLQGPGLWRASPLEQRREVLVRLQGKRLVLLDPKNETALAHWALAALTRETRADGPAIFRPGHDALESLEPQDEALAARLGQLTTALQRRKSRPGRLRGLGFAALALIIVGGTTFWLPGVLTRQTAAILPPPNLAELGQMVMDDVQRLTGSPCGKGLGLRAASALSERLLGKGAGQILVVREGLHGALALPGGLVVISRDLLEAPPDAETAAGFVIAALAQRGSEQAQTTRLLRHAGLLATLRLLTSGTLPEGSMDGIAEQLLAEASAPPQLGPEALLPGFVAAELSPKAYSEALSGASGLGDALAASDPFKGRSPRPVLEDSRWISLQSICFE